MSINVFEQRSSDFSGWLKWSFSTSGNVLIFEENIISKKLHRKVHISSILDLQTQFFIFLKPSGIPIVTLAIRWFLKKQNFIHLNWHLWKFTFENIKGWLHLSLSSIIFCKLIVSKTKIGAVQDNWNVIQITFTSIDSQMCTSSAT